MTPAASNRARRYPGLKPFERNQSAVFYGRGEDIQRFANLVVRERLVVLFAKSGIGKTSLLQAGVAPELEQQGFAPIFLRCDKTNAPLVDTLGESLEKHPNMGGRTDTGEIAGDRTTLWERMKRIEFDLDGLPATPVLVFDQFEEVFTLGHSETSRRRFLGELADLANEAMPEAIRSGLLQRLQQPGGGVTPEVMQWWERQPELRIVVSIRSDFLHLLDEISPLIPNILRNRYQLQPLNRRQAAAAIEEPARSPGVFAGPVFTYRADALQEIINFLAGREAAAEVEEGVAQTILRRQEEIESFNLQILCQYVEEKIIRENRPAAFEVTPEFYNGLDGLEREIRDFYWKQLQALPDTYVRRTALSVADREQFIHTAQCLIEESLVTPIGRRCSMVDDFLTATWGIDLEFLDTLVETRLLRKELRLDDFYYEISHDTLLPAIIESRDNRRRREKADQEKAEFEERLAAEAKEREAIQAELKAAEDRRRMARRVAIYAVGSVIVMLLSGIWIAYDWRRTVRKELEQAELIVSTEAFHAGVEAYLNLASQPLKSTVLYYLDGKDLDVELAKVQKMHRLYDTIVIENMIRGDSVFFSEKFAEALHDYREAYDSLHQYAGINDYVCITERGDTVWRIQRSFISDRYADLYQRRQFALNAIVASCKFRLRAAEEFEAAGVWAQALRIYLEIKRLLPHHADDRKTLETALQLRIREDIKDHIDREIQKCRQLLKRNG